ncbi:hypothetical protein [Chitinophaga sp. Cy-1792]|uniref:hypothetical protein n=1 Tax=Chitinophaga sp. Cy-1792 TaxID=2608339 RepID=UPI0014224996|nr:hypothetical protein [Chitinophaga sp. Cy-1792]NIG56444.1 hypothetical protein [Chitinophaga sp. Cy-1792]
MNKYKHFAVIFSVLIYFLGFSVNTFSQTTTSTNPTSCGQSDGTITIYRLAISTNYTISYRFNDSITRSIIATTDTNGIIVIRNLPGGVYDDFLVNKTDAPSTFENTDKIKVILENPKIAKQVTKFFGSAYANFTGIQDDDPKGFAQFYARLSQPLNKSDGISCDAKGKKRFIFLRNFTLQMTYGNTDGFKMYTYDTLGNRYVNRLDLLAHAYFNGTFNLNALSFIVPMNWNTNPSGDMAHIYLDFIFGLAVTNVTDTLKASTPATDKLYNIKSNYYGFNLKASFSDAFKSNFNIELAYKMLLIAPSTSIVNPNENPQNSNVSSIHYPANSTKSFLNKGKYPYNQFDVWISYNTGSGSNGNQQAAKSNSCIFIKYTLISNWAGASSRHYANNYFQFQIGYILDISKIFYQAT